MVQMDILLVDDSPEVAELTRIALDTRKLGNRMAWCADAEAAVDVIFPAPGVAIAKDLQPRLILLDLHLPLMSGHDFLRMIKTNQPTAHIPGVLFSSADDQRDIVDSDQLGANGYLMKAADPREFIGTVGDAGEYWVNRNKVVR